MIEKIISSVAGIIIAVISKGGYPGVVLLMAIESACIPLPSEIIMPFSGALTVASIAQQYGRSPFSLLLVATMGAIGCNLGSVIAYEIGCYGGRPLVERYGRYILLNKHDLELADRFFRRFGSAAVFIGRLLPVVRTFIALPAGISRMPRIRFHLYTFLGSWPWCLALAWVGMKLGEKWQTDARLRQWLHRLDFVIVLLILAAIAWFVYSHWRGRLRLSSNQST